MVVASTTAVLLLQVVFFVRFELVFFMSTKVFVLLRKVNHVVNFLKLSEYLTIFFFLFAVFSKQFVSSKHANLEFMQLCD